MKRYAIPESQSGLIGANAAMLRLIESSFLNNGTKPQMVTFDTDGGRAFTKVDDLPRSIGTSLVSRWEPDSAVIFNIGHDPRVIWLFPQATTSSVLVIRGKATIRSESSQSAIHVHTSFENRFRYLWGDGREVTINLKGGDTDLRWRAA